LRLLVQFHPDLIAIATVIKHQVSYPKGDCTKDQKAKNTHLTPPQAVADAKCGTSAILLRGWIGTSYKLQQGTLLMCNLYSVTTNQAAIGSQFSTMSFFSFIAL
jgi:hypothetical protein